MPDRSSELLQALVDDEDLEGLLQVVTMDEVADAWCRYTERREHAGPDDDADPDWWAIEFFMMRPIFSNGRVYRSGLLALLRRANSDYLVSCVAAGPLENFVSDDESDLRWLEQEAARNEVLRRALTGVWCHGHVSEATFARLERAAGQALPRQGEAAD